MAGKLLTQASLINLVPSAQEPNLAIVPRHVRGASLLNQRFSVKALNRDNLKEAEQLVELFTSNYGSSFPHKQVYDTNYWYDLQNAPEDDDCRMQHRSIVALDGNRFVGHLALKRETRSDLLEIIHPAIHPAYRKHVFELSRLFWSCLEDLANRQGWMLAYHFSHVKQAMSQLIAAKCFRSIEVALIPSHILPSRYHIAGIRRSGDRTGLLAMYNIFHAGSLPSATLYPPPHHAEFIRDLYYPLRLNRIFRGPGHEAKQSLVDVATQPAKCIAYDEDSGISFVRIETGLKSCIEEVLLEHAKLELDTERQPILKIPLDDPACASVCAAAEQLAFRFCGIMPLVDGHDYLLYSRFDNSDLQSLTLYTPRAQALRSYLLAQPKSSVSVKFH